MLTAGSVRYVALLSGRRVDEARATRAALAKGIATHAPDLRKRVDSARITVWTSSAPYAVPWLRNPDGRAQCVGWAFERGSPRGIELSAHGDRRSDRWWERAWGGFVAFETDDADEWTVCRSVDGILPARILRVGDLVVVASDAPAWLFSVLGMKPDIDWSAVAQILDHPSAAGHRSAIRAIENLAPGCCWSTRDGRQNCYWRPADFARAGGLRDPIEIELALRNAVDQSVGAWVGGAATTLVEVSGGLDSATVAGTLAGLAAPGVSLINHATQEAGGDERRYARIVAEHASFPLYEIRIAETALDLSRLVDGEHPVEPLLYGLDLRHDEATARVASAIGADRILTGQGGDALFFQMPTLEIAADIVRLLGPGALLSTDLLDAARRARRSIWSAWRLILQDRFSSLRWDEGFPAPLVTQEARELMLDTGVVHPWLRDLDDLPPAKVTQIRAFVHSQIFNGPTARAAQAPLLHPLLAQPVAEVCLATPIPLLAFGMIDRARARAAFADRLPPEIVTRASKGEAAGYYAGTVRCQVDFLRELLLNGCLVRERLLNRAALEQALRVESLIARDIYRPLLLYASTEAWASYWLGVG